MSWTNINKPAVGDTTKKQAFADAVVDDLLFLYNQLLSITGSREVIINGSFESDVDGDSYPDGWTRAASGSGGSILHDTSTSAADGLAIHGKRSIKMTSPGGVGSGGYQIESTDFFEISETRTYFSSWQSKSSVAGINNVVEIQFYDSTQTSISITTLYDSAANPTAWTLHGGAFKPPANSRYAKFRLIGAKTGNTTAGSVWFDDVRILTVPQDVIEVWDAGGTWTCPRGVYKARVKCWGGGGGASATTSGGGGGGYGEGVFAVTPGTGYAVTIGAAGTFSAGAGGTSSLGALISSTGGVGGSGATPGAGGTSAAPINVTGQTGSTNNIGGSAGGGGGQGGHSAVGTRPGGAGGTGAGGAAGRIIIEYFAEI